jgi:hypothetical protein
MATWHGSLEEDSSRRTGGAATEGEITSSDDITSCISAAAEGEGTQSCISAAAEGEGTLSGMAPLVTIYASERTAVAAIDVDMSKEGSTAGTDIGMSKEGRSDNALAVVATGDDVSRGVTIGDAAEVATADVIVVTNDAMMPTLHETVAGQGSNETLAARATHQTVPGMAIEDVAVDVTNIHSSMPVSFESRQLEHRSREHHQSPEACSDAHLREEHHSLELRSSEPCNDQSSALEACGGEQGSMDREGCGNGPGDSGPEAYGGEDEDSVGCTRRVGVTVEAEAATASRPTESGVMNRSAEDGGATAHSQMHSPVAGALWVEKQLARSPTLALLAKEAAGAVAAGRRRHQTSVELFPSSVTGARVKARDAYLYDVEKAEDVPEEDECVRGARDEQSPALSEADGSTAVAHSTLWRSVDGFISAGARVPMRLWEKMLWRMASGVHRSVQ